MNSTLLAVIITLGIFSIAGLFGLIEALGDRHKWLKRQQAEHGAVSKVRQPLCMKTEEKKKCQVLRRPGSVVRIKV